MKRKADTLWSGIQWKQVMIEQKPGHYDPYTIRQICERLLKLTQQSQGRSEMKYFTDRNPQISKNFMQKLIHSPNILKASQDCIIPKDLIFSSIFLYHSLLPLHMFLLSVPFALLIFYQISYAHSVPEWSPMEGFDTTHLVCTYSRLPNSQTISDQRTQMYVDPK